MHHAPSQPRPAASRSPTLRRRPPTAATPLLAALAAALMAAGCGGDGDDDDTPDEPAAAVLRGTVAVGAALAGAQLTISDRAGAAACSGELAPTTAGGEYSCSLAPAAQAPLLVVATDPAGGHAPMVAVLPTLPAPGSEAVTNVTPLTTAIVGQLAPDRSALSVVATPSLVDTARLEAVTQAVVAQLGPVLASLQLPAGFNPFSTPLVAATASTAGNAADQLIDVLRITQVNGVPMISTVDRSDAPVAMADGVQPAPTLAAPPAAALDLAGALKLSSQAFTRCFALPLAQRVLATEENVDPADGGPRLLSVAPACEDIAADDYLHQGYTAQQAFHGLMTRSDMTGATFDPPQVLRYIDDTSAADRDAAVVNMHYRDAAGVAGNFITVARRLAGTATAGHATDWWLHGNQAPVEASITASIRRNEQLAPSPGTPPFANTGASRYESGLNIFINMKGPGSRGMRAARVKGPGLPTAGLVYTPPRASICTSQNWLNLFSKDGNVDPAVALPAPDNGNIFRLQRTQGLAGAQATTVRANPNAGTADNSNVIWAHPLDYGQPPGSTAYVDFGQLRAHAAYTFEVFYEGETTARHTLTRTTLTPVMPATAGASLRWHALDAATLQALDPAQPAGGAQASLQIGWQADPYAEPVRSVGVYSFAGGRSVNQGTVPVAHRITTVTATAPTTGLTCEAGERFMPLAADGSAGRSIQLRYRMPDGSFKDSLTRYN
ncbi:hypothetical protein [Aquincola sp. J276]|uniref:hypothetical protein n=1 Tax=Aquincola sp. J276 TaxID=2898432 RepID=UPI0021519F66|nr:hypothetical protein [Aquincola sp. J276]MCR5865115.1 hypothetical protein [Aquincola sp. J276]